MNRVGIMVGSVIESDSLTSIISQSGKYNFFSEIEIVKLRIIPEQNCKRHSHTNDKQITKQEKKLFSKII